MWGLDTLMAAVSYQSRVAAAIAAAAARYGVDPAAMTAVGRVESGLNPNAIGDGGHSVGLFQFNDLGAGKGMSRAQRMDPMFNANAAARMFAQSGGRGLRGRAAVEAFVRNFERPANPNAEIAKALGYLAGGGAAQQTQVPPMPARPQGGLAAAAGYDMARLTPVIQRAHMDAMNGRLDRNGLLAAIQAARVPAGLPAQAGYGATAMAGAGSPGQLLGAKGPIIGTPGVGTHTLGNWQSDNAIDIRVPVGTPVYAPQAGVIDPKRYGSLGSSNPRMAGLRLNLIGQDPAYFAHLSRLVARPGQRVRAGDLIGYTGSANGVSHLHFSVQNGDPRRFYS